MPAAAERRPRSTATTSDARPPGSARAAFQRRHVLPGDAADERAGRAARSAGSGSALLGIPPARIAREAPRSRGTAPPRASLAVRPRTELARTAQRSKNHAKPSSSKAAFSWRPGRLLGQPVELTVRPWTGR